METNLKYPLSDTLIGKQYIVSKITSDESLKHKLYDFGVINGTVIKPLFESMSKNARTYQIHGFLIAIRNTDAKNITVTEYQGGNCDA